MKQFLYVYATGEREDGYRFCVGSYADAAGTLDGGRALFRTAHDAQLFAYAVQADSDATVHILPSAEVE